MADVSVGVIRGTAELDDRFTSVLERMETRLGSVGKNLSTFGANATRLGHDLLPMSLGIAAIGGGAAKLAIDFESSFAGIVKTTDGVADKFGNLTKFGEQLKQGMRDLSKEIPVNVNELNRLGEAAGQLGIKQDNILGFTKVMAQLGVTTNMTSDMAADSLARLANVTKMPQENFDRLGSTIVALGNNSAATETDITEFATRIAGAGKIAGLTEANILAIGTAMASAGVEAEAGGTAVQKVLIDMTKAVNTGSSDLAKYAEAAGMTATQFKQAFQKDAAGAFTAFVQGLSDAGQDAFSILDELGLKDARLIRAFTGVANSTYTMTQAIKDANVAWAENSALGKEAEARFRTVESQMILLWNRIKDVGITLGEALLPSMKVFMDLLSGAIPLLEKAVGVFTALPAPIQAVAVAFGVMAAAAPFLLMAIGSMSTGFGAIMTIGGKLIPILTGTATATTAVGTASKGAAAFEALFVKEATAKVGILGKMQGILTSAVGWFKTFGTSIMSVVTAMTSWSGIVTTATRVLTALRVGFAVLTGPIGLTVTAFTLLVPLLWKAVGGWEGVKNILGGAWQLFKDVATIVWDLASRIFGALLEGLNAIGSVVKDVVMAGWQKFSGWVSSTFAPQIQSLKELWQSFTGIFDTIGKVYEGMKQSVVNNTKEMIAWVHRHAQAIRDRNAEDAAGRPGQKGREGDIALDPNKTVGAFGFTAEGAKAAHDKMMAAAKAASSKSLPDLSEKLTGAGKAADKAAKSQLDLAKALEATAAAEEKFTGKGFRTIDPRIAGDADWRSDRNRVGLEQMDEAIRAMDALDAEKRRMINELGEEEIRQAEEALNFRLEAERENWRIRSDIANEEGLRLMEEDRKRMVTYGSLIKGSFKETMAAVPDIIVGAIQGGGNPVAAVAAKFGGDLGLKLSTKIGESLSKHLGGTMGKAIGGMLGPLGAMLGPLVGELAGKLAAKVWNGIKGVFGSDEEARDVNPARDAFMKKFGDVANKGVGGAAHNLAAKLTQLTGEEGGGQLFRALQAADTMKEFSAAVQAIEAKLAETTAETEKGLDKTTDAAEGFDYAVTGSDEAVKALGETQEKVMNAMLQGFDKLMVKLDEFIANMQKLADSLQNVLSLFAQMPGGVGGDVFTKLPEGMQTGDGWDMGDGYTGVGTPQPISDLEPTEPVSNTYSLTINPPEVHGNILVGSDDEFRQAVTDATLAGIEEGGEHWEKFAALSKQGVEAA